MKFYKAAILNPISDTNCHYYAQGLLVINGQGRNSQIKDILPSTKGEQKYQSDMTDKNTVEFRSAVIMPGFFDMHFHWVQDDVRQMPKDSLLEWLEKYTFPTEMKFSDKNYSQRIAKSFFRKLSSLGTLGGACYSSIHEHAIVAALKEAKGDFVIGNVSMNMNSPKKLTQTEEGSIAIAKRLIKKFKTKYCFTPRFAITTTPKVMKRGSEMADKAGCYKQTHLSETPQEIEFVLSIYRKLPGFEKVKSYTEIYEKTGMLGKHCLMGHGIHLSEEELHILKKTKTSIIHCPTSNAPILERGLGSGLFDFRKTERAKVRWALGSDIGGGPFLSMFDVMRSYVNQNKKKKIKQATYVKALYRATLAGAKILEVDDRTGNLEKGKQANFIVVQIPKQHSSKPEDLLQSLIKSKKREHYDQLVHEVYLNGTVLFSRSLPRE